MREGRGFVPRDRGVHHVSLVVSSCLGKTQERGEGNWKDYGHWCSRMWAINMLTTSGRPSRGEGEEGRGRGRLDQPCQLAVSFSEEGIV